MKKIDMTNYEEWIIDWLDGNLDDVQVDEVLHFLDEHPGLKEEFGDLELFRLIPAENQYRDRERLHKTGDDLTESQFEYLCAASMENDLTPDQKSELDHITRHNPERKKILDLTAKTKLIPIEGVFPDKKSLYRRTLLQNVIRLSFIGLSAAAVITIAFILYFTKTHDLPVKYETTAQALVKDTSQAKIQVQKIPEKEADINLQPAAVQHKNKVASIRPVIEPIAQLSEDNDLKEDSSLIRTEIQIAKIQIEPGFSFKADIPQNLIALNYTPVSIPEEEAGSKIGRFITKTIREKILREKTSVERPLKGYELAKAGVEGLNILMGWEMALGERKDEEGNLKSIYFSSKLLKFNAPVKKTEAPR
jgi:hypothetical protein